MAGLVWVWGLLGVFMSVFRTFVFASGCCGVDWPVLLLVVVVFGRIDGTVTLLQSLEGKDCTKGVFVLHPALSVLSCWGGLVSQVKVLSGSPVAAGF